MNQVVLDTITALKSNTRTSLKYQQTALTPIRDDNFIECRTMEYIYNGNRTILNPNIEVGYRCRYMYLRPMDVRKYIEYNVVDDRLEVLVNEGVIYPFLLFINGRFVPWSMIRVILSNENYFLVIEANNDFWIYQIQNVDRINTVRLPDGCRYYGQPIGAKENKMLGFDEYGLLTNVENCQYSILDESAALEFVNYSTTREVAGFKINDDPTVKYYPENVLLFRNSELDTDTEIHFDSTYITIGDGTNYSRDTIRFNVYRNIRSNGTKDNVSRTNVGYFSDYLSYKYNGFPKDDNIEKLLNEFDFNMSRKKLYQENVDETIDYITKYNPFLFSQTYSETDKTLTVEEMSGQEVLDAVMEDGTLKIGRRHGRFSVEYIIMLVNGVLYEFYYMIKYFADYCIIPIQNINAEDRIEFLRFTDINNNTFDTVINKNDPYGKYDTDYINDSMVLFSTIPPTNDFTFPEDGLQHFPVEYTLDYNEDGEVKIILSDERYYGKTLKMTYKNQYHHYWFDVTQNEDGTDSYSVDLGTKFMYCNDYSRYMVFYNGRRLGTDQYRLCLPVRSTTPFYRFELFLTNIVSEGDRVDVIYTPSLLKDVILDPELNEDGTVTVDKSDISYSLDKSLYLVWANGKKIPMSWISNIDSTHIKFNTDIETTKTICITKFIDDIEELAVPFGNTTSEWDQVMSNYSTEELCGLLGIDNTTITNTETDYSEGNISIRSLMLELIRQKYVMNAGVDTTKAFVYDYQDVDDSLIDGYDADGNALLAVNDANETDNINDIERDWK
jgi:hypothetical protein